MRGMIERMIDYLCVQLSSHSLLNDAPDKGGLANIETLVLDFGSAEGGGLMRSHVTVIKRLRLYCWASAENHGLI